MSQTRIAALAALLSTRVAAGEFTPDSSKIGHPAVAHMLDDRRLSKNPNEMRVLADQALAMGEERVLSLIAERHGVNAPIPCLKCDGTRVAFSLAEPDVLRCQECNTVLTEETFPPTGELSGTNELGETVTYRYFEKDRNYHCIAGRIRELRHNTLALACRALGRRYYETGDEECARLVAAVLDRFATAYRHWPVIETTKPRSYLTRFTIGPERPYDSWGFGRWSSRFMYEIQQDCLFGYDLTYKSEAWGKLSAQRGYDARKHVEDDLFREAAKLSWEAHDGMGGHLGNLNPSLYQRAIHLGRVLNDPDLVHRAVQSMQDMVRMSYHFDGMEYEGAVTYHGIVTGRLGIAARMLSGYSDPPGYVDEHFGIRLENASFGDDFAIFGKAWNVWAAMKFPNGNPVCIHDTNFPAGRAPTPADAEAPNIELNAYGHYALGRGKGPDAMQAHLHFCPRYKGGHFHTDRLGLILWAAGEELLPDIGYVNVGKPHRYFVNRAICHNTVEVSFDESPVEPTVAEPTDLPTDPVERFRAEAESQRSLVDARSNLLAYDPGTVSAKQVQLIAASSPGPQWMGIPVRERSLLMVAVDENRSYLVDVFRVAGGNQHQFVLRPSVDEDVTTECSLDLTPRPGTLAGEEVPYGKSAKGVPPYSWLVHDLTVTTTSDPWRLTWTGKDSSASIRCHFRGQPNSEVILAKSPTLRRGKQDARLADEFQGPHLLVRRRGETGFASVFGAVYDCWRGEAVPAVDGVEWIDLTDGAIAIRVRLGDREDLLYFSTDDQPHDVRGVRFAGKYAVLSRANVAMSAKRVDTATRPLGLARPPGRAARATNTWAWAHGNGIVTAPGLELRTARTTRLPLAQVLRKQAGDPIDGFVVTGKIDSPNDLPGQWLRVLMGDVKAYGYRIEQVAQTGDTCRITIHYEPGFELTETGSRLLFNPFYETEGQVWVEVARAGFVGGYPVDSSPKASASPKLP